MKTPKIKKGMPATVNRREMPTLLASELSDYHAFNPARVEAVVGDRVQLSWQDGYHAWFDRCAIVMLCAEPNPTHNEL